MSLRATRGAARRRHGNGRRGHEDTSRLDRRIDGSTDRRFDGATERRIDGARRTRDARRSWAHCLLVMACFAVPATAQASEEPWLELSEPSAQSTQDGVTVVTFGVIPALDQITTISASITSSADASGNAPAVQLNHSSFAANASNAYEPFALTVAPATDSDGSLSVVEIEFAPDSKASHPKRSRFYFRHEGSAVQLISFEEYHEILTGDGPHPTLLSVPTLVPPPSGYEHATPAENPWSTPEEKAFAEELLARHGLATMEGPLDQVAATVLGGADVGSGGCNSAGRSAQSWMVIAAALALGFSLSRRPRSGRMLLVPVAVLTVLTLPSAAKAATCYLQGYVAFWDTIEWRYSESGSRHGTCVTGDTSCVVTDADCCYSGIPYVAVKLHRGSTAWGDVIQTTTSGSGGYFVIWDTECDPQQDYFISVHYQRSEWPAHFTLTSQTGTEGYRQTFTTPLTLSTSSWTNAGQLSVNASGDTTSLSGDLAAIWKTAYMTAAAVEADGETRLRKVLGSGNSYDRIMMRRYSVPLSFADCDDNGNGVKDDHWVALDPSDSRRTTPAHELGHILHVRTVGCSGDRVGYGGEGWGKGIPEGGFYEGYANLIRVLTFWDPSSTATATLQSYYPCTDMSGYDNSNDTSDPRNIWYAIWELLDSDNSDGDASTDYFDLTLKNWNDAMWSIQSQNPATCSQGQNRTVCEFFRDPVDPELECDDGNGSEDCDPSDTCEWELCYTGDPHGRNLRDVGYTLAALLSISDTNVGNTLSASHCVGPRDDNYPYTGGYHFD